MESICINLKEKTYTIEIAENILPLAGSKIKKILPESVKAVVISDSNVAPLYGEILLNSLKQAGYEAYLITIIAGETSKNMSVLAEVLEKIAEYNLTRSDVLITLGGGVVGDLGGFAAASYMRGIAYVQIPTSLLAQIDSSIGGKVAVDLKAGKNLAGTFYQPQIVLIDPLLLKTLPVRYLHDGLAEAIKYGCIKDAGLFGLLAELKNDTDILKNSTKIIKSCCDIKSHIVEQDEFDTGVRMLLNFGHTLGHAIEQHYAYSKYTHGESVAIGMYQITKRTETLGLTEQGTAAKIAQILDKYGLPKETSVVQADLLKIISKDKKKTGNEITVVVLEKIGSGRLYKINWQQMPEFLG